MRHVIEKNKNTLKMFSPRIRLPTAPNTARRSPGSSWNGGKPLHQSTSKPLENELKKFSLLVKDYEEENIRLRRLLNAFNTAEDNQESKDLIFSQFEEDLDLFQQRIDKRSLALNSIEKKVTRKREEEVKLNENSCEKTQLLVENQQLVNKALFLEKKMIASKLRLRLSHDHRDFCSLKRQSNQLSQNDMENNEEDEIYVNKMKIHNLKSAIEHEKSRLMRITVPPTLEEEAAESIQRIWRGYSIRKMRLLQQKPPLTPIPPAHNNKLDLYELNLEEDSSNAPFPELEQSEDDDIPIKIPDTKPLADFINQQENDANDEEPQESTDNENETNSPEKSENTPQENEENVPQENAETNDHPEEEDQTDILV